MDKVLYSNKGGAWTTEAGKFFWPVEGDLHFYAYAPQVPGAADAPGTYEITSSSQKLANFSPCATAAEQKDFVYAYAKGNLTDNGTSGVDVDFKHALTEVSIAAKNDNSAYTVEVTGVKLGNIKSKGTFTFPAVGGATPASWDLAGSGVANYETTWTTANKLGKTVSSLDASNVAFMLLPQQLATNTKASAGNYIALKVKITMQGGEVLHNDWTYIGIDTNWEMGKHYTYTLDFTSGAGQTEAGKMIISGKDVKMNVQVDAWTENKPYWENYITGYCEDPVPFSITFNYHGTIDVTPDSKGNWKIDLLNYGLYTDATLMFENCTGINCIDLSHFNASQIENMPCMFEGCSSLMSVSAPNLDTKNVTSMLGMFDNCGWLAEVDLSGWNTSKVETMSYMFYNCSNLDLLDLSDFNTSNVEDMEMMFTDCKCLRELDLSGWNLDKIPSDSETAMGSMFSGCKSLETIRMVGCNEATVNKVKAQLTKDGITGVTIITK